MLEQAGTPAGARRSRAKKPEPGGLPRRRALPRAPRQPVDRRQHLQGPRRQRARRARGGLRRHRPREERLPAHRRDRAAGRRDPTPRPRPGRAASGSATYSSRDRRSSSRSSRIRSRPRARGCRWSSRSPGATWSTRPTGEGVGVSKRLDDKERDRLRKQVKGLDLEGGGAIVRTAAHGAKREDFERELPYLFKLHRGPPAARRAAGGAVAGLPGGRSLGPRRARHLQRRLRARASSTTRVSTSGSSRSSRAPRRSWSTAWSCTRARRRCSRSRASRTSSQGLISRRVDLPSGGYLMIDYAEALTVFDVNSGSFVGRGKQARLEDTITKTNLEAADEVVRQLRLRDIGGHHRHRLHRHGQGAQPRRGLKTLRASLDQDRTKTFTAEISKLGLVEMTRQNVTEGVREIISRPCPTCDGDGVVLSEETVAIEFDRRLRELASRAPRSVEAFLVQIQPGRQRRVHRGGRTRCCTSSRRRPARSSTSRAPTACRSITSR